MKISLCWLIIFVLYLGYTLSKFSVEYEEIQSIYLSPKFCKTINIKTTQKKKMNLFHFQNSTPSEQQTPGKVRKENPISKLYQF
jgi:hypothetical protein